MEYISRPYALANLKDNRHVKEVIQYLAPTPEDKILEIGCGRGFVAKKVQEITPSTHGIDINPEAIKTGVAENLEVMDAEELRFGDRSFDKIYSFHTIEHVPSPRKMLAEIVRVLRPKGKVLLVYPAEPVRGLFSIPAALIIFKNPLRARQIHLHRLNPKKIQKLIKGLPLRHVTSKFSFFSSPQYFTVLEKV